MNRRVSALRKSDVGRDESLLNDDSEIDWGIPARRDTEWWKRLGNESGSRFFPTNTRHTKIDNTVVVEESYISFKMQEVYEISEDENFSIASLSDTSRQSDRFVKPKSLFKKSKKGQPQRTSFTAAPPIPNVQVDRTSMSQELRNYDKINIKNPSFQNTSAGPSRSNTLFFNTNLPNNNNSKETLENMSDYLDEPSFSDKPKKTLFKLDTKKKSNLFESAISFSEMNNSNRREEIKGSNALNQTEQVSHMTEPNSQSHVGEKTQSYNTLFNLSKSKNVSSSENSKRLSAAVNMTQGESSRKSPSFTMLHVSKQIQSNSETYEASSQQQTTLTNETSERTTQQDSTANSGGEMESDRDSDIGERSETDNSCTERTSFTAAPPIPNVQVDRTSMSQELRNYDKINIKNPSFQNTSAGPSRSNTLFFNTNLPNNNNSKETLENMSDYLDEPSFSDKPKKTLFKLDTKKKSNLFESAISFSEMNNSNRREEIKGSNALNQTEQVSHMTEPNSQSHVGEKTQSYNTLFNLSKSKNVSSSENSKRLSAAVNMTQGESSRKSPSFTMLHVSKQIQSNSETYEASSQQQTTLTNETSERTTQQDSTANSGGEMESDRDSDIGERSETDNSCTERTSFTAAPPIPNVQVDRTSMSQELRNYDKINIKNPSFQNTSAGPSRSNTLFFNTNLPNNNNSKETLENMSDYLDEPSFSDKPKKTLFKLDTKKKSNLFESAISFSEMNNSNRREEIKGSNALNQTEQVSHMTEPNSQSHVGEKTQSYNTLFNLSKSKNVSSSENSKRLSAAVNMTQGESSRKSPSFTMLHVSKQIQSNSETYEASSQQQTTLTNETSERTTQQDSTANSGGEMESDRDSDIGERSETDNSCTERTSFTAAPPIPNVQVDRTSMSQELRNYDKINIKNPSFQNTSAGPSRSNTLFFNTNLPNNNNSKETLENMSDYLDKPSFSDKPKKTLFKLDTKKKSNLFESAISFSEMNNSNRREEIKGSNALNQTEQVSHMTEPNSQSHVGEKTQSYNTLFNLSKSKNVSSSENSKRLSAAVNMTQGESSRKSPSFTMLHVSKQIQSNSETYEASSQQQTTLTNETSERTTQQDSTANSGGEMESDRDSDIGERSETDNSCTERTSFTAAPPIPNVQVDRTSMSQELRNYDKIHIKNPSFQNTSAGPSRSNTLFFNTNLPNNNNSKETLENMSDYLDKPSFSDKPKKTLFKLDTKKKSNLFESAISFSEMNNSNRQEEIKGSNALNQTEQVSHMTEPNSQSHVGEKTQSYNTLFNLSKSKNVSSSENSKRLSAAVNMTQGESSRKSPSFTMFHVSKQIQSNSETYEASSQLQTTLTNETSERTTQQDSTANSGGEMESDRDSDIGERSETDNSCTEDEEGNSDSEEESQNETEEQPKDEDSENESVVDNSENDIVLRMSDNEYDNGIEDSSILNNANQGTMTAEQRSMSPVFEIYSTFQPESPEPVITDPKVLAEREMRMIEFEDRVAKRLKRIKEEAEEDVAKMLDMSVQQLRPYLMTNLEKDIMSQLKCNKTSDQIQETKSSKRFLTGNGGRAFNNKSNKVKTKERTLSAGRVTKKFVGSNVRRKLYCKELWITKRLYSFVQNKLKPKYGLMYVNESEAFMKFLANAVGAVERCEDGAEAHPTVDQLKRHMADRGVIITHRDFGNFVEEYLPHNFRIKSIPATGRNVPKIKGKIDDPVLKRKK